MNEQLISLETSKLAKEKGFDHIKIVSKNNIEAAYNAPTQSLLQKWIREVHNIHITVYVFKPEDKNKYCCDIISDKFEEDLEDDQSFDTYEEALEQALYQTLELIK